MPTYGLGDAIRTMRMRAGYTQEELSYGICSPATLSRIENGKSIASKQVFEALAAKLDGLNHVFLSCDTEREMERSHLCKRILLSLEQRKLMQARDAIRQYHRLAEKGNPFCEQFELYAQAIYQAIAREREGEILPKLKKALRLTMPDGFNLSQMSKKSLMLTYDEIYILSNMGIAHAKRQDMEKSFQIFYYLKSYVDSHPIGVAESLKLRPMILGNYAWFLEQQGRFEEAVKHCDAGIELSQVTGKYTILPHFLCTKARCLAASGNPEISRDCLKQAETILDLTKNYGQYGCFQDFCEAREPVYVTF